MKDTLKLHFEDLIENYSARIKNLKHDKEVAVSSETLTNLISNCENATNIMVKKIYDFNKSYASIIIEDSKNYMELNKDKEKYINEQLDNISKIPANLAPPLIEGIIKTLEAQDTIITTVNGIRNSTYNAVVLITSYILKPNDDRFKDLAFGSIKILIETILQKGPIEDFIILLQETFTGKSNSLKEMNDNLSSYENYIKVCNSWVNTVEQILEDSKIIFR